MDRKPLFGKWVSLLLSSRKDQHGSIEPLETAYEFTACKASEVCVSRTYTLTHAPHMHTYRSLLERWGMCSLQCIWTFCLEEKRKDFFNRHKIPPPQHPSFPCVWHWLQGRSWANYLWVLQKENLQFASSCESEREKGREGRRKT